MIQHYSVEHHQGRKKGSITNRCTMENNQGGQEILARRLDPWYRKFNLKKMGIWLKWKLRGWTLEFFSDVEEFETESEVSEGEEEACETATEVPNEEAQGESTNNNATRLRGTLAVEEVRTL